MGYGGENGSCATQETLDVFGYGTNHPDCRFSTTFFSGIVHVQGVPLVLSSGDTLVYYPREVQMNLTGSPYVATAGARMSKYAHDPGTIFDGQLRNSDIVLFRLADVYLMMAEAKVRNGEDGQTEFELVRLREALALSQAIEPRDATLENIYVFRLYRDEITGRPTMSGGQYHVDMLPTTCHIYFGEVIGATANGRRANKPVSEGISPEKFADTHGPTAVIKSCAKMDHCSTGGTLLNQKFTPSAIAGETGLDNLASLIRTYFAMDGHHIQFNVFDRQTLLEAQKHPDDYKDLIVRVAG